MSRRLLAPLPAVLAALLVAGCGGASTPSAPGPDGPAKSAPQGSGALRVGATDLRLGDASVADGAGLRELRVGRRKVDPDTLRRTRRERAGVGAGASCADVDVLPTPSNVPTIISATLCLINGERADAGLPPLSQNERLAQAAVAHSQDMVDRQYFAHVTPDGVDVVGRIRPTGYIPGDRRWTVGENLAWGTGTLATPRNIVLAWMNSQGHRENVLRSSFAEIGFGVVPGNPRRRDGAGATYTTNFGAIIQPAGSGSGSAPAAPQVASNEEDAAPAKTSSTAKGRSTARKAQRRKARRARARRRARAARRQARRVHARATARIALGKS